MNNKTDTKKNNFSSRSSLAKPKNSNLSYQERLALAGKEKKGVDFNAPIDPSGYMTLL